MQATHCSCQQSCLTKNSVSLHCDRFSLLFLIFLSRKKVCGRNHKAKLTSQSSPTTHSNKSVFTLKEKRRIVLRSQCSVALSSSSLHSNGVKTHHILSRPALALHLPWRLCWTPAGVLTGPKSLTGHKLNHDQGLTEREREVWSQAPSIPLTWKDNWHFRTD